MYKNFGSNTLMVALVTPKPHYLGAGINSELPSFAPVEGSEAAGIAVHEIFERFLM